MENSDWYHEMGKCLNFCHHTCKFPSIYSYPFPLSSNDIGGSSCGGDLNPTPHDPLQISLYWNPFYNFNLSLTQSDSFSSQHLKHSSLPLSTSLLIYQLFFVFIRANVLERVMFTHSLLTPLPGPTLLKNGPSKPSSLFTKSSRHFSVLFSPDFFHLFQLAMWLFTPHVSPCLWRSLLTYLANNYLSDWKEIPTGSPP